MAGQEGAGGAGPQQEVSSRKGSACAEGVLLTAGCVCAAVRAQQNTMPPTEPSSSNGGKAKRKRGRGKSHDGSQSPAGLAQPQQARTPATGGQAAGSGGVKGGSSKAAKPAGGEQPPLEQQPRTAASGKVGPASRRHARMRAWLCG